MQTVAELVTDLGEMITSHTDGIPAPMLHMLDDAGQMYILALAPDNPAMAAPLARLAVARQDAAVAVLALEATSAITRATVAEEPDLDRQRLLRGDISVSGLPREKQQQLLLIYGEDRAGNELLRVWVAPSSGYPRHYTPFEGEIAEVLFASLRPIYLFRELMIERQLNEYQARKIARKEAVAKLGKMGMVQKEMIPLMTPPGSHPH